MNRLFVSILILLSLSFADLISPENGAILNATHVKFEWEQIVDAQSYIIELHNADSNELIISDTDHY